MIEKKIRRFELNSEEALVVVGDYLSAFHRIDMDIIKLKLAIDTVDGGLVIEVEVEG